MGQNCPVLSELAVTEDYDREHEQAPVLSGGDYDISAIRDCATSCLNGAYAWQRLERIRGIARILGLTGDTTSAIEDTLRELIRSRDEWMERERIAEAESDRLRMQVKAAEAAMGKAVAVIAGDTDEGLDALCAIQSWQITPTEMYYRNEAEMTAAKEAPK